MVMYLRKYITILSIDTLDFQQILSTRSISSKMKDKINTMSKKTKNTNPKN